MHLSVNDTKLFDFHDKVYESGCGFLMISQLYDLDMFVGYLSEIESFYLTDVDLHYKCTDDKVSNIYNIVENTLYIQEYTAYNSMKPFGGYNSNIYDLYFIEDNNHYKLSVVFPNNNDFMLYYDLCIKTKSFIKPFNFLYVL